MRDLNDLPRTLYLPPPETPRRVTFRVARSSDLRSLHQACFAERPLAQFGDGFRRALTVQRSGRCVYLVAEEAKRPIATGQLIVYGDNVEIADVAVAPDWRGRGVGTALITVLTRIATYAGFDSVEICVMQDNVRARALYERLGFVLDRSFTLTESATVAVLRKALHVHSGERPLGGTEHEH